MVVFGRGVVDLSNGSISVREIGSGSFELAHRSENLALLALNFVLNLTATVPVDAPLLAAVSYLQAVNLTFAGTLKETMLRHAGQVAFSCLKGTMNCSTCPQNEYLLDGMCVSQISERMNCGSCSRGFVRGVKSVVSAEQTIDET